MKIIQVNDTFSFTGGSEKTLRKCSEQLAALGHDVIIAHGEDLKQEEPAMPWREVYLPELSTCTPLGDQFTCRNELAALISRERPNVVHARSFGGFGNLEQSVNLEEREA